MKTTETRGVLAAAYKGKMAALESLLTHLAYVEDGIEVAVEEVHHENDVR